MKQSLIAQIEQQVDELVENIMKLSVPQQAKALQRLRIKLDVL